MLESSSPVLSGLMGVCIGDALGFPVQFISREVRVDDPVTGMSPYSLWSDDSSLTFCLAESMCGGFSLEAIADAFIKWLEEGFWTPHGHAFDMGMTTLAAIDRLKRGIPPVQAGGCSERSNGNGSLMRILPLAFYHQTLEFADLIQRAHEVSCITHAHPRAQMACGIYVSIATQLLTGCDRQSAYLQGIEKVKGIYENPAYSREISHFNRVLRGKIADYPMDEIKSSGYVVHTLEAALWSWLNTSSYAEAVLTAVNLGDDTDTTAAVAGGLAGIEYGLESIPRHWVDEIPRKDDIIDLANRLEVALTPPPIV